MSAVLFRCLFSLGAGGAVAPAMLVAAFLSSPPVDAAPVAGQTVEHGEDGACIRIAPFPGAVYSQPDHAQEQALCALDFERIALCPKLWSTSPATVMYDVGDADPGDWEAENCRRGSHARDAAESNPGMFKMSVNAHETSATYAPASWVYYHLSRYFDAGIHVPVAVYRSMGAAEHNQRVTQPGLEHSAGSRRLRMLAAGWRFVDAVETGETTGRAASAMLTDDGQRVYGVLLKGEGRRYGAEINGTRESGWGSGQNEDFQQTAPFIALRDPRPVEQAARAAIETARRNPKMAEDLPADTPVEQVVFWMQDVLEIVVLDYILGQQDRIGNIDYRWRWVWVEDGEPRSQAATGSTMPPALAVHSPVRIRQSALNDNDAGVRAGYADFAERTGMLDDLRHFSPRLYDRLGRLAADLAERGPAWTWMTEAAGLSESEAGTIARRASEAFARLQADCRNGTLKLDLVPAAVLDPALAPSDADAGRCEIDGD